MQEWGDWCTQLHAPDSGRNRLSLQCSRGCCLRLPTARDCTQNEIVGSVYWRSDALPICARGIAGGGNIDCAGCSGDSAHDYAAKIRSIVLAVSERTGARALLFGAGYAVLATLVLIALLRLIAWGFPQVHGRIETLRQHKLPAIRIQQFELLPAGRLSALLDLLAKVVGLRRSRNESSAMRSCRSQPHG